MAEVDASIRLKPQCTLSTGTKIEADIREIDHPYGRFEDAGGRRFDVLVMDLRFDPSIDPPHRHEMRLRTSGKLQGERDNTCEEILRVGYHRMVSGPGSEVLVPGSFVGYSRECRRFLAFKS